MLGDYDVDGVSSTALLVSLLRRFGLNPSFVVPRRMEDGYGLSRSAIDRALEVGKPDLFIALDCGTNSQAEVSFLQEQGIDVLIIDHHREGEGSVDSALLDQSACVSGRRRRHLAQSLHGGTGVQTCARTPETLAGRENHPVAFRIKLREYLDLVAMGTIADLVPLTGENRLMARHGLRILESAARPGVRALMEVSGVRPELGVQPMDISFRLGPRINASGRLADAALSVDLMLSDDVQFCFETAQQLDSFNRERQDIERQIVKDAEKLIEKHYKNHAGIVLYADEWHPGVVGIVAGRVSRQYNRPCVVLGNEGELAKGSGRSVDGVNLVEVLADCDKFLGSWGGHPMAVGVAVPKEKLEDFRQAFAAAVTVHAGGDIEDRELAISAWIKAEQIGPRLMDELDALHPFGQANAEPVFGLKGIQFPKTPDVFKEAHFRFSFEDERRRRLFGVAWKMAHKVPPARTPVDIAVHLRWNHFNDRKLLQLELIDWRLAK